MNTVGWRGATQGRTEGGTERGALGSHSLRTSTHIWQVFLKSCGSFQGEFHDRGCRIRGLLCHVRDREQMEREQSEESWGRS